MAGIYAIENIENGKLYIGSGVSILGRWDAHKCLLRKQKHWNKHLQNAWNKDGEKKFKFQVIQVIEDVLFLEVMEQKWIDLTRCYDREVGYNLSPTAGNTMGFKMPAHVGKAVAEANRKRVWTDEMRKNHARISSGRKHTQESKQKISKANKGKKRTAEMNKRASEIRKGQKLSFQHSENISKALKGRKFSDEHRKKAAEASRKAKKELRRGILQFDLEENLICCWDDIQSIEEELGYKTSAIYSALSGKCKTSKGFIWKYDESTTKKLAA